MLTIKFLAILIGATKSYHDSGKSKIYYILLMLLGSFYVTEDWLATLLFMVPLVYYAADTGNYHKAEPYNTYNDFKAIPVFDNIVDWVVRKLGLDYNLDVYRRSWGSVYCVVCSIIFTLPFLYTNYLYSLPLLLWVFVVRQGNWWLSTGLLYGFYTLLFLWSFN